MSPTDRPSSSLTSVHSPGYGVDVVPSPIRESSYHNHPSWPVGVFGRKGHVRDLVARHLADDGCSLSVTQDVRLRDRSMVDMTAAVVMTDLYVPGLRTRVLAGDRLRRRTARYRRLIHRLQVAGVRRLVLVSSAFLYGDDDGTALMPGSPVSPAAETMDAWAAEQAAAGFTQQGGDVVTLRSGWVYFNEDRLTREITAAARRGWQLIEGPRYAYVPAISAADVAGAVAHALTAPPGVYNVGGDSVRQDDITTELRRATGRRLQSLGYPGWRDDSTLFGASRRLSLADFHVRTGFPEPSEGLLQHLFDATRRDGWSGGKR